MVSQILVVSLGIEKGQQLKTKVYSKCKRELPITEFNKHRRSKDGLQCSCKQCQKEYVKAKRLEKLELEQERKNFIENENPKLKDLLHVN